MPKPLTYTQAVKLANEAIDKEIKKMAIDANLWERYGRPFHGKGASEKRKKLKQTKAMLEIMLKSISEEQ